VPAQILIYTNIVILLIFVSIFKCEHRLLQTVHLLSTRQSQPDPIEEAHFRFKMLVLVRTVVDIIKI